MQPCTSNNLRMFFLLKKCQKCSGATWEVSGTLNDTNSNTIFRPDRKLLKGKIPMAEARLSNGNPQSL
jgi:hypothetical protein